MRTKSYWPRTDTDSHGYNKARAFFFLIRVHPRSSVANKVSLVLAQGSAHLHSMRSGVQRLVYWSRRELPYKASACRYQEIRHGVSRRDAKPVRAVRKKAGSFSK